VFIAEIPLGKGHLADNEYIVIQPVNVPAEKHTPSLKDHLEERYSPINNGKGKIKLLIIEDNKDLRNFIKDSLSNDFAILEAENGTTGINTAFAAIPDLIITDIMMPELDGISLCTRLKNDDRTSHIPIIMLTAKATTENRIEGLKSGADDYLAKPFNMDELRIRIVNLITNRETLKQKYSKLGGLKIADEYMETTDDRFVAKIIKIINARISDHAFGVETLCDLAGMSKRQLTRKLKSITGFTPGTIIRNLRLEKAAEYLLHNAGNISEAANLVGLSNPSHFTNSFRKYFGVSPKNYKGHRS
jgi:YesN/AraC family two-component response regulator